MFSTASFFCTTWIIVMIVSLQMHGSSSCIKDERKGLLELKAYYNKKFFYSWPNETDSDCCRWEGVKCDLTSGRVISLVPTLNYYPNHLPLNLSLFHPFGELRILNLSILASPYWLDEIHGYKSLGRLKKLEVLDLRRNNIKSSDIPFLNAASSLKTLILSENYMNSSTFRVKELKNLRNLRLLDLSRNSFTGPLPGLENFRKLQRLDLSNNELSGLVENTGICQLKNLQELDLSQNQFIGQFSQCFDNLTQLRVLDVSSNQLNGTVPTFISNMDSIEYLSLSDNEFEGFFSLEVIANLSKLKVFKLSSKSSMLQVDGDISLQPRFQLSDIKLQNCNLEKIPSFLQHQKELHLINLSYNKLTGSFPSWFLVQNLKLEVLLLKNNSFTNFRLSGLLVHSLQVLDVSANEFEGELPKNIGNIFPNLRHWNLSNNGFHGNLSSSLGEMNMLQVLDLSRNNLFGDLPREFLVGCYSLVYLKLSYNKFTGHIFSEAANLTSLSHLIADNNQFSRLSVGLQRSNDLLMLDLSSNELRGVVPSWLGELSRTIYLSLSNNLLEGTIPRSLFNISDSFSLMDLSRNKFSGSLPTHFNCELVCRLFLNDNELSGVIPETLLENLIVLNLGNNYLSGTIPRFTGTKNIQYLLLRGNRLTGHIPNDLCDLNHINMLDLANNRLNGSIPSCLTNMSFGRKEANRSYIGAAGYGFNELASYSGSPLVLPIEFDRHFSSRLNFRFEFASKSRYDSYNERSFKFMSGLDLSNNELSGEIPKELGDLVRMRALNLSHNSLSGLIPKSFSNLTDIESIDLSYNILHGPIPYDLTRSHSLAVFNVSYNNLSGSIPSQGHFLTLDETNYIGNPLLCGSTINRRCDNDTSEPEIQSEDGETTIDIKSFYLSLVATYSVTWIAFTVFLCFDTSWRQAWFRLSDVFINLFKWV